MINYMIGALVCVVAAVELVWMFETPRTLLDTPIRDLLDSPDNEG